MRRAAKRDTTEREIVAALRKVGALVLRLDRFDLLVFYRGRFFMFDAKTGKGRATFAQETLIAEGWPLSYVRSPIEALALIGAIHTQETIS